MARDFLLCPEHGECVSVVGYGQAALDGTRKISGISNAAHGSLDDAREVFMFNERVSAYRKREIEERKRESLDVRESDLVFMYEERVPVGSGRKREIEERKREIEERKREIEERKREIEERKRAPPNDSYAAKAASLAIDSATASAIVATQQIFEANHSAAHLTELGADRMNLKRHSRGIYIEGDVEEWTPKDYRKRDDSVWLLSSRKREIEERKRFGFLKNIVNIDRFMDSGVNARKREIEERKREIEERKREIEERKREIEERKRLVPFIVGDQVRGFSEISESSEIRKLESCPASDARPTLSDGRTMAVAHPSMGYNCVIR